MDCSRTGMPQVHLRLQGLELVGDTSLDFSAHLLAGPLLEAAQFLVHVHFGCVGWLTGGRERRCGEDEDRLRGEGLVGNCSDYVRGWCGLFGLMAQAHGND